MKKTSIAILLTVSCAFLVVQPLRAIDFTLSDAAIMSLDYKFFNATIASQQDIAGPGVQFNIHFPSTIGLDRELELLSDKNHGAGTLAGIDISGYSNFKLNFSVLSVDGLATGTSVLYVGADLGPAGIYSDVFYPKMMTLSGAYPSSVTCNNPVTTNTIDRIGFVTYMATNYPWSAGPHDVTLVVSPTDGAVAIPEASTGTLLVLGLVALFWKRRSHLLLAQQTAEFR